MDAPIDTTKLVSKTLRKVVKARPTRKMYTAAQKYEVALIYHQNGCNAKKTKEETGVSIDSIKKWYEKFKDLIPHNEKDMAILPYDEKKLEQLQKKIEQEGLTVDVLKSAKKMTIVQGDIALAVTYTKLMLLDRMNDLISRSTSLRDVAEAYKILDAAGMGDKSISEVQTRSKNLLELARKHFAEMRGAVRFRRLDENGFTEMEFDPERDGTVENAKVIQLNNNDNDNKKDNDSD